MNRLGKLDFVGRAILADTALALSLSGRETPKPLLLICSGTDVVTPNKCRSFTASYFNVLGGCMLFQYA